MSQKLLLTKFKGITKKIYIQELWFLRSARLPMLVNIYTKFHEDILTIFKLQSGYDFVTDRQMDGRTDEIEPPYLKGLPGQTDGRTTRAKIMYPNPSGGRHNFKFLCMSA